MTEEELERSWNGLSRELLRSAGFAPKARCDYSDLLKNHCAHCLGHEADFDIPKKELVYE